MNEKQGDNPFEILCKSLVNFRTELEGDAGRDVASIGDIEGTLQDTTGKILNAVKTSLEWLYDAVSSIEPYVNSADAAVAVIEVLAETLQTLSTEVSFGDLPERLGISSEPFDGISKAAGKSQEPMNKMLKISSALPRPEDISGIRNELEWLLDKSGMSEPDSMTLINLISKLG